MVTNYRNNKSQPSIPTQKNYYSFGYKYPGVIGTYKIRETDKFGFPDISAAEKESYYLNMQKTSFSIKTKLVSKTGHMLSIFVYRGMKQDTYRNKLPSPWKLTRNIKNTFSKFQKIRKNRPY